MIYIEFTRIYDHKHSFFYWLRHPSIFIKVFLKREPEIGDTCLGLHGSNGIVEAMGGGTEEVLGDGWNRSGKKMSLMEGLLWFKSLLSPYEWRKKKNYVVCAAQGSVLSNPPEMVDQVNFFICPSEKTDRYSTISYNMYSGKGIYTTIVFKFQVQEFFTGDKLMDILDEYLLMNGDQYEETKTVERTPYYVPTLIESP